MSKKLSELPVGAKVRDKQSIYNGLPLDGILLGHNHDGSWITSFMSEKIITLKCFDAAESENTDSNRRVYGNCRYKVSNLLQWLNSAGAAGDWYVAQHSEDAPPTNENVLLNHNEYDQESGFLTFLSKGMRDALQTVNKVTVKHSVDGGGTETVSAKIHLLSATEIGFVNDSGKAEDKIYDYFLQSNKNARRVAYPTQAAVNKSEYTISTLATSKGWRYWLRSFSDGLSHVAKGIRDDGTASVFDAYDGRLGVRPTWFLPSSILVSDNPNSEGYYEIEWGSNVFNSYIGIEGSAKKIKSIYVGVNSIARKVSKFYVGVNDKARQSIDSTFKLEPSSFNEATNEEITFWLDQHRAGSIDLTKYWHVGDERSVHLSAMAATGVSESHNEQDATLVILHGSDVFDLVDGNKNIFVIGLKNMLANDGSREGGYINSSNTNIGGWKDSARRSWCDNVFMPALSEEVQKWFRKFKYKASAGNQSTNIDTLENYFTLPAEYEVFGSTSYSASGENTIQMDYYKDSANRMKYPGDESASSTYWWERSPNVSNTTSFCCINSSGFANNINAAYTFGISPFGCV